MTKALFDTKITPACSYCAHGTHAANADFILCPKKGVVTESFYCKKFEYDPLKRIPKKPIRQKFSDEDFSF